MTEGELQVLMPTVVLQTHYSCFGTCFGNLLCAGEAGEEFNPEELGNLELPPDLFKDLPQELLKDLPPEMQKDCTIM